ncbi:hypothetical protein PAN31117_02790 [Pandoraea anapnoica]|uniref:Uncharacterized protein n=1 Tax=Pandoraea anapnoica TaxID=2508301 RepID=A0A5E5A2J4_9BURK|nr:hypothetical protein PAN31117_02790 [Pandoraea anapnoica]
MTADMYVIIFGLVSFGWICRRDLHRWFWRKK